MVKLLLALLLLLFPLTPRALDKEFDCLVRNVYYESRGEPEKGKIAVALVTLNRVGHPRFPKTICSVVYQKNQFSWTKGYKKVSINAAQWQAATDAALAAYMDRDIIGNFKATHFHSIASNPKWNLKYLIKIANHKFYTFK